MGEKRHGERDYRMIDVDGNEVATAAFANLDQATAWVEEQAMERDLSKWTLQAFEPDGWADRVSTKR